MDCLLFEILKRRRCKYIFRTAKEREHLEETLYDLKIFKEFSSRKLRRDKGEFLFSSYWIAFKVDSEAEKKSILLFKLGHKPMGSWLESVIEFSFNL